MSDDDYAEHEPNSDGFHDGTLGDGFQFESFTGDSAGLSLRNGCDASVNKRWLLRSGWTRTMIRRLLGPPDRTVSRKRNPSRPECRYNLQRVDSVMASKAYRDWAARRDAWNRARRASRPKRRPFPTFEHGIPPPFRTVYWAFSKRDRLILRLLLVGGLRQAEAARKIGVSQQTVSRTKRLFFDRMKQHVANKSDKKCF